MAKSNAKRQKLYRTNLLKNKSKFEEMKRKARIRDNSRRQSSKGALLHQLRARQKQASKKYRKALKRAVHSLPKDINKRIMVVQHLAQNLNIISKTTHQHTRQQRLLSIELKELVSQFYQRDDITYQLPGKRDYVTVTDDNGESMTLQKRILLYNIRETYQLFVNEYSNKNVDLSLTSFNELRPMDFSENFRLCMQNAVQNSYYSQDAVSLFTTYVWYAGGGGGESFVYISNNLTHDKYCVNASIDNLLEQLTQRFQHLQQVHIFSDGSSQQLKQKFLFRNVCRLSQQHKMDLSWHYFATSQGKGVVDAVGGTLNRLVHRAIKSGERCTSAADFVKIAQSKTTTINVMELTQDCIDESKGQLEQLFKATKSVPETKKNSFNKSSSK
ncbi:unnamed protein product [Rotaria sp. Silwood1]|nr:unnamed protein product [Rotaria sp. Silwood1]CAF4838498.1 unnamed protein product [Rotaria sp. Silwood1]